MVADPGDRQIGDDLVVLVELVEVAADVAAAAITCSMVSITPFGRPVVPEV